jgi:transposase
MKTSKTVDARRLSPAAQEELRRRVMAAVRQQGMRPSKAARVFGVSRASIYNWTAAIRKSGLVGLKAHKRGPKRGSRLAGWQAATIVRLIEDHCPDQLKLPFALWTREAVRDLIQKRFGLRVSVWTAGRYLKRWGFTPQKPIRRAYERTPEAVARWLREEYPAIQRQAKAEGAEIHWGDEMGMRSDHQTGTSYGRRGRTPVIPGTGQRFGCNLLSTITNRGHLSFMVFRERFTTPVLLRFLRRLLRQRRRAVFLILDGHPVHRAVAVRRWVEKHAPRIRLFFLPGYSPELNPDEYLNNDVKANAVGRRRAMNQPQMIRNVRGYLRSTQRRPDIVRAYFQHHDVQYAAG